MLAALCAGQDFPAAKDAGVATFQIGVVTADGLMLDADFAPAPFLRALLGLGWRSDLRRKRVALIPAMDGPLVLQLGDPFPRGHQLRLVAAGHPRIRPLPISCCRRQV